jgi:hypothetical protein
MGDRSATRRAQSQNQILAACWIRTTEPGPYPAESGKGLDWSKALIADRMFATLQIRSLTYGDDYEFPYQCTEDRCRERFDWSVNLSTLPVRPVPEESLDAFKSGNRLEITLPQDVSRRVWFRLLTGADEARMQHEARMRPAEKVQIVLSHRILEIEGVPGADRVRFIQDMELADIDELIRRCDDADGGVETDIQIECPHCLAILDVPLPFETFWQGRKPKPRAEGRP